MSKVIECAYGFLFLWSLRACTVSFKCFKALTYLYSAEHCEHPAQPNLQNEEFRAFPHRHTGHNGSQLNKLPLSSEIGESKGHRNELVQIVTKKLKCYFVLWKGRATRWQTLDTHTFSFSVWEAYSWSDRDSGMLAGSHVSFCLLAGDSLNAFKTRSVVGVNPNMSRCDC